MRFGRMAGMGIVAATVAFSACNKPDTCPEVEAAIAELESEQNGSSGRMDRLQATYDELGCYIESCNRSADEIVGFESMGCMGEPFALECELADARELQRMRDEFGSSGCAAVVCPRLNDSIVSQENHINTTPVQSLGGLTIAYERLEGLKERAEVLGCAEDERACEDISADIEFAAIVVCLPNLDPPNCEDHLSSRRSDLKEEFEREGCADTQ